MSRRPRIQAATLTGAALVAGAVVAAPAHATTVQLDGGATTLTLDKRLGDSGIKVTAAGGATPTRGGVVLAITGGRIDPRTATGTIEHAGGVQFRAGKARVRLTGLSLDTGKPRAGSATSGATRLAAFSLSLRGAKVRRHGFDTALVGVGVALTAKGAAALNRGLHVRAFRKGTSIGTAALRSQPAEIVFRGGMTSLALDPGMAATLQGQGIAVAPAGAAVANADGSLGFPIDHGRVNAKTLAGSLTHRGRLSFTRGETVVTVSAPVLVTSGIARLNTGLGTGRLDLLSLDVGRATDTASGRRVTLGGVVGALTDAGAAALNQAFATTAFTRGMVVGTMTVAAAGV
jgi:hypothetical protein